ncbi:beta-catenin binding [Homalodisca vitripennis]|nr:beta-catenin binding [Homalodisca vitripennis]
MTLFLVLFVAFTRRRVATIKKPNEDDVRENIISYRDEGGGEDDLNAVDLLPLGEISRSENLKREPKSRLQVPELIEGARQEMRLDIDLVPPPPDDLRYYAFEGNCNSVAGSLSSLGSGR